MPLIETPPDALAEVYARSLFELAEKAGGRDAAEGALSELEAVLEIARSDARFGEFLSSRVLPVSKRAASLEAIFKGRVSDLTLHFLLVLNDKGRLGHLPAIVGALDNLTQEAFGRVEVDVFTAAPLSAEEQAQIKQRLDRALGRDAILHAYTDAGMLGGVKFRVGDRLVDGSLATQLRRLRDRLSAGGAAALRTGGGRFMQD